MKSDLELKGLINGNDQHFRRLNSTWYSVWGGQLGRIGQQQQK